ncbi:MAG: hypothetical protein E7021_05625 [Alphaproteobacteria bacterium]|nr:hypothetical protein [Alphaproteobacteria bacterium]
MSVKNKTNKNYKRSQKGRSMVEMLGVLAIVGVLSVGGLYGYGVAMKKHKANQLLHEASMQAATVSAQIMSGKDPTGLTDFGTGNNITLDTNSIAGNTTFKLKMAGIGKDVCEQMKNSKGGMVRDVDCDEATGNATITYYKNLATDPAEGEKSPTGGAGTEKDPVCQDVKCESGQQCIGGACAEVNPNTTNGCSKNSDCDEWCKDNGGGEECYCQITADFTGDDSACWENFTGQCAVATTQSGVTGGYTVSADYMTWWSAVNFCKAHNKSLVSLADLSITGGYQDDAYCEGSDCTRTFTWSDLQDKLGSGIYWVTDAVSCDLNTWKCTSGTNNNSCFAFFVNLSAGAVNYNARSSGSYDDGGYALCE